MFHQKHDFASASLSLRAIAQNWYGCLSPILRLKVLLCSTECVCQVEIFILDLIHQWNDSEVEFMESDMKDPSERHSFLILRAPVIKECCPLIQYTQKKVTHVVSICINLDCMRVEFFFQYLQDDFEVLPRYAFV